MIFYFSATGNCKHVAHRIAKATNDECVSITECMKNSNFSFLINNDEAIGFIIPTYAWGLPIIVSDFLEQINIKFDKKPYVYFVATYGTTPGQTGFFANRYMKQKEVPFTSQFSVKMPDTWTPIFDLTNQEKVREMNINAEPQIDFIIEKIRNGECGDFMRNKVPRFAAKVVYNLEYDVMRKTKNFFVEDTCVGCGLCAKKCPVSAIEIQNKKPIWIKEQCVMCLGCLHHCPKFSIQYGKNTKKHGQYTNPNVKI
ncbi:EFR1 family ferrodoxin [Konateibacter massiliensis]|uniref:EFR1 family ferrodoxin n=1 Tax=Konateibacter massiliensis TaxID=2002841 RepID=UPI000C159D9A|nr:EFR1 family ferrodoxin [Konateibacter massiliensis]